MVTIMQYTVMSSDNNPQRCIGIEEDVLRHQISMSHAIPGISLVTGL